MSNWVIASNPATYNAEGKIATIHESLADNPLRLQGQYADKETGLSYNPSHYTHLPTLYPIVLSDDHTERADELGEAGV